MRSFSNITIIFFPTLVLYDFLRPSSWVRVRAARVGFPTPPWDRPPLNTKTQLRACPPPFVISKKCMVLHSQKLPGAKILHTFLHTLHKNGSDVIDGRIPRSRTHCHPSPTPSLPPPWVKLPVGYFKKRLRFVLACMFFTIDLKRLSIRLHHVRILLDYIMLLESISEIF